MGKPGSPLSRGFYGGRRPSRNLPHPPTPPSWALCPGSIVQPLRPLQDGRGLSGRRHGPSPQGRGRRSSLRWRDGEWGPVQWKLRTSPHRPSAASPMGGGTKRKGPGDFPPGPSLCQPKLRSVDYSTILATTPAPTVRPPSRMAKRSFSSMAIGVISSTSSSALSPGMIISTPSRSLMIPVTSVVRK